MTNNASTRPVRQPTPLETSAAASVKLKLAETVLETFKARDGAALSAIRRGRKASRATLERATRAVLKVGDGRGFVVEGKHQRFVITAAHCLPSFPPCHPHSYLDERTYQALLGPIGETSTVWAECVFVDPIGDIAVLAQPDGQELPAEWEAYQNLVDAAGALRVGDMAEDTTAWVMNLDGMWMSCRARALRAIMISEAHCGITAGMSGSPILSSSGLAVGVLSVSGGKPNEPHTEGGPQARLRAHLPGWLLQEVQV
jgi:hypothetical protein